MGYIIIGIALFLFVQAKNVYPQLLLGRLFFSLGGAAASTMVTAVLPTMSWDDETESSHVHSAGTRARFDGHVQAPSIASEATITPNSYRTNQTTEIADAHVLEASNYDSPSKIAGLVGMATGCGALVALSIFLPLPARFQKAGADPGPALQYSYYIVGAIALLLAVVCVFGLRGLKSEFKKGSRFLFLNGGAQSNTSSIPEPTTPTFGLLYHALLVGFKRQDIFVGYVGGFVARASSVGISLFVPLLVNAAFLSSGLCAPAMTFDEPNGLPDIKRRCPRAYVVAAELTGVSQLLALLCAPLFGYWSSRLTNKTIPLMFAAVAGIVGYPLFAQRFDPHDENKGARAVAFVAVCLIGISQIGAIVCSLGILSSGVLEHQDDPDQKDLPDEVATPTADNTLESAPLLRPRSHTKNPPMRMSDFKGSVAGIYSFYGGAGILILTKAGGTLFDKSTTAAPFYMMATFNAILLLTTIATSFKRP